ncbi:hypothetical protein [Roseovarius sp. EL26]|uniref:hypothetical protein n=1 Tax=Roseovarius sp. EL26 TaxID=2126672 RepID=UPI000EA3ACD4|nr:hypothetical protein [Roseovarius sp. EL26]
MLDKFLDSISSEILSEEPREAWLSIFDAGEQFFGEKLRSNVDVVKLQAFSDFILALRIAANELSLEIALPVQPVEETNLKEIGYILKSSARVIREQLATERFKSSLRSRGKVNNIPADDVLKISNTTLINIHPKLQSLRSSVVQISMEEDKREKLLELLNSFERELNSKEISKSGSLKIFATVGAIILGTTTFLAEAPDALETIGEITAQLGVEINAAEEVARLEHVEQLLLSGPTDVSMEKSDE